LRRCEVTPSLAPAGFDLLNVWADVSPDTVCPNVFLAFWTQLAPIDSLRVMQHVSLTMDKWHHNKAMLRNAIWFLQQQQGVKFPEKMVMQVRMIETSQPRSEISLLAKQILQQQQGF